MEWSMYRATRELIKERSRFCDRFRPKLVNMHWVENGEVNSCFSNTLNAKVKDVNNSGSQENPIISGWMVHAYNRQHDTTEIIQHWWNFYPMLKIHFDTTPLDAGIRTRSLEFVEDQEIFEFGKMIQNKIKTHVGKNLVFMNKLWFSSEITSLKSQLKLTPLKDLSHHNLLHLKT